MDTVFKLLHSDIEAVACFCLKGCEMLFIKLRYETGSMIRLSFESSLTTMASWKTNPSRFAECQGLHYTIEDITSYIIHGNWKEPRNWVQEVSLEACTGDAACIVTTLHYLALLPVNYMSKLPYVRVPVETGKQMTKQPTPCQGI